MYSRLKVKVNVFICWIPGCDGLVCDVSQCIPSEVICDEVLDCKDGADEEKSRCDQTTITGEKKIVKLADQFLTYII